MSDDEKLWKNRVLALLLARLGGLGMIMFGLAVAFSDIVRAGGFRPLGGLLIALGTIELVVVPLLLRRQWRQP